MAGTTVTIVKKVTVGTPIRNVTAGAFSITNIEGVYLLVLKQDLLLLYKSLHNLIDSDMSNIYTEINGGTF